MRQADRVRRVPLSEIRVISQAAREVPGAIHLEVGEPDFPTAAHIVEAAHRAMAAGDTHYTAPAGTPAFREAVARKLLRENGIPVDPATEVLGTPGAAGALALALLATVDPGDEVLVPDPGWPNYATLVRLADGVPVPVPLVPEDGFRLTAAAVRERLGPRTRALILNSPSNPTGAAVGEAGLRAVVEACVTRGVTVIADEVYEHVRYPGAPPHWSPASEPAFRDHVITCNSLSKTYAMCGWRVGYAAGPADVIAAMGRLFEPGHANIGSFAQAAAVAALDGPQDCVAEMVAAYRARRDLVVPALRSIPGLDCLEPEGAFYAWVDVRAFGRPSAEFALDLLRRGGVATVPGTGFGRHGEGWIRLSFATRTDLLEEALERIDRFCRSAPRPGPLASGPPAAEDTPARVRPAG